MKWRRASSGFEWTFVPSEGEKENLLVFSKCLLETWVHIFAPYSVPPGFSLSALTFVSSFLQESAGANGRRKTGSLRGEEILLAILLTAVQDGRGRWWRGREKQCRIFLSFFMGRQRCLALALFQPLGSGIILSRLAVRFLFSKSRQHYPVSRSADGMILSGKRIHLRTWRNKQMDRGLKRHDEDECYFTKTRNWMDVLKSFFEGNSLSLSHSSLLFSKEAPVVFHKDLRLLLCCSCLSVQILKPKSYYRWNEQWMVP